MKKYTWRVYYSLIQIDKFTTLVEDDPTYHKALVRWSRSPKKDGLLCSRLETDSENNRFYFPDLYGAVLLHMDSGAPIRSYELYLNVRSMRRNSNQTHPPENLSAEAGIPAASVVRLCQKCINFSLPPSNGERPCT